jgi:hypothetical protein
VPLDHQPSQIDLLLDGVYKRLGVENFK